MLDVGGRAGGALGEEPAPARRSRAAGTAYLCVTCGTQFTESAQPPAHCPICEDERQYVNPDGQKWTTLEDLRASHKNIIKKEEDRLYSINTEPKFGIGQRAFLIQTDEGERPVGLRRPAGRRDDRARSSELGGIAEIAISHPHYYTSMVEWSRAFGGAPIHLHEAERPWVMRPDPCIRFWTGRTLELRGGLKLVSTGGHFEGYQVLHWPAGAGGRGALMAGDQPQICMDPKQVTFMYSYPNYIPLNGADRPHRGMPRPLPFDRIYGAFFIRGKGIVPTQGKGGRPPVGGSVSAGDPGLSGSVEGTGPAAGAGGPRTITLSRISRRRPAGGLRQIPEPLEHRAHRLGIVPGESLVLEREDQRTARPSRTTSRETRCPPRSLAPLGRDARLPLRETGPSQQRHQPRSVIIRDRRLRDPGRRAARIVAAHDQQLGLARARSRGTGAQVHKEDQPLGAGTVDLADRHPQDEFALFHRMDSLDADPGRIPPALARAPDGRPAPGPHRSHQNLI